VSITLYHYLGLAAALFAIGVVGVVTRRNAIGVLIGVELILNAANINLVGFSRFSGGLDDYFWFPGGKSRALGQ